jgi:cytochrome c5
MRQITQIMVGMTALALCCMPGCVSSEKSTKVEAQYNKYCFACHGTGAAGAPKSGDSLAWKPRLAKGKTTLLESVTKGMVGMPPKGRCQECTPDDLRALIDKMAD